MKTPFILLFIPVLIFGQSKSKKFKLPEGAQPHHYASSHVLVKLKPEHQNLFSGKSQTSMLKNISANAKPMIPIGLQRKSKARMAPKLSPSGVDVSLYYEVGFSGGNVEAFINQLYATGFFELVEPDYIDQLHYATNDPEKAKQYYLGKIRAIDAWDLTKGSEEIIIGIVDSGGDMDHPDLQSKIYIDPAEPIDGIDNDNDGFIDNNSGWDFMGIDTLNVNDPDFLGDNDASNPNGGLGSHGSNVAGCAAAATDNGIGISGVGFKTKILFTKHAADNQGADKRGIYRGYTGILYMATHGAKIINCSWGGTFRSQINQDVITHVTLDLGCLVVASAGNENTAASSYPASYDHVLSVAASNSTDVRASFSNFGKTVDIIAPGVGIYTTAFNNTYESVDGTSFSSPITAGAAALVLAKNPTFTATQVGEQLRVTADETVYTKNTAFYARKLGKGRLDVLKALTKNYPSIRASNPVLVNANGSVAQPGENGFLTLDFTNFLAPSSAGLTVTVTPAQGAPATITNGTIQLGVLATNGVVNNNSNPVSMKISATAASNAIVDLILTYADGEYKDYQYVSFVVNPTFLNIDDNTIITTIAENGRIGFENTNEQTNGVGLVFNENKLLYEMGLIMGTSSSNLFNNVRSINNGFNQDFLSLQKIKEISPGERSFSEVFGVITDNAASKTISIDYRSLVWKEKPYDQFVILEYKVKNVSTQPLNGFHFAIFADWDITDNGGGDVAEWDADNNMGYVHPALADDKPFAGIKVLKGAAPEYFAIDNNEETVGTPFGIYDGFTDDEKFQTISSGIGRAASGQTSGTGNDVSHVVGAGPYNLAADEEVTITFALVAGLNFGELQMASAQADTAYNFMLAAEKPMVEETTACYGGPATVTATGATLYNWYTDFTGGEPIYSGNTIITNNLFSDTVFYVSNANESYESVRTAATVVLTANSEISASGSTTICDGTSVTLSVAEADEYLWSNGETTQEIEVTEDGNYSVNVKDNDLTCSSDSETIEVTVNPSPVSQFTVDGALTITTPITFTSTSTGATSYSWNFGDTQTSTSQNPTHTFSTIKEYTITLTVENDFGCSSTSTETISVITAIGDELSANTFTAYPNPFREALTLQSKWTKLEWQVLDMQGKVHHSEKYEGGIPYDTQVLMKDLPPGIYLLRATNGNRIVMKKLVKH